MADNEYLRFLQTLKTEDISSGVRKIANVVLGNLDDLQPLGTAQSQRVKKIAKLASETWPELSENIEDLPNEKGNSNDFIKRLKSIKVGPFRGFAKEETLSLNSSLVLIYGPNGTGKSSFCEALEYGLLGSVEEAQIKRFANQPNYFKNAHVNKFASPFIVGINESDQEVNVSPNEELYRYCFIEKNRIDNFSRMAAQAPAKQTELISSLFGLDSFYSFVKNFSREIDSRHLDLEGQKGLELKEKQKEIEIYANNIEDNEQLLTSQSAAEAELAHKFKPGTTFEQLVIALGTDDTPGEIQALEAELQDKHSAPTGLTLGALESAKDEVESSYQKLTAKAVELSNASEGLSFKQLYEALLDLEEVSGDNCPSCKTPLADVIKNPFELAKSELGKLGHLAQLELEHEQLKTSFTKAINSIFSILQTCASIKSKEINPLDHYLVENKATLDWAWWKNLESGSQQGASHWLLLKEQVQKLEELDIAINKANHERAAKQAKLSELRKFKESVIELQAKRKVIDERTEKSKAMITDFDETNKLLIEAVEAEKPITLINQEIASSYKAFVDTLVAYKENLPNTLVADLGDLVVTLYNAFNRTDATPDLLASIKLPLTSGQRIEISYNRNPEKFFDALHILSEGHIRCIGLAILLAKNLRTNSPLIIFDDPVNAIDDEHRSSIRETLFKDDYFKNKQIILACHGNEFIKDTYQLIGKKATEASESYKFLPQYGENHIVISTPKRPVNYVLAASQLLEEAEYRDALMSSRRGLEHLSEKAWSHYGKHCNKNDKLISVSRRTPSAPWDLRNLAENLKVKINKSAAEIPNKTEIIDALDSLLGVSGQDPHWVYLNKGTHEESDREEFDHRVVQTIVTSLEKLDTALSNRA